MSREQDTSWQVKYGFSSSQPTQELDDEELLLEPPLLRLGTDGATAIEAGGDFVK